MKAVHAMLHARAARDPAAVCITGADGRAWSAGELERTVRAVASGLAQEIAAGAAARASTCEHAVVREHASARGHTSACARPTVAIELPPGGEWWAACLAITRIGCDALLLPEHPHTALRARVEQDIAPCARVTAAGFDRLRAAGEETGAGRGAGEVPGAGRALCGETREVRAVDGGAPGDATADACGGVILVSSGTTGWPRFVRRTAAAVDGIAAGLVQCGLVRAGDIVGSFLPMHHAYGFEHAFIGPALAGATVVQHAAFSLGATERMLAQGATVLPLVPATVVALVDAGLGEATHALRVVVSAGSPLRAEARARFREAFRVEPVDLYGATEVGTIWLDRGSGGVPVPGVDVRVEAAGEAGAVQGVDGAPRVGAVPGVHAAPGEPGEIMVRSATRFDRIIGRGAGDDTGEWFRTGDLGVQAPDGTLRVTGRLKLVFDVAGLKVNPFEVEAAIEAHPVVHAAVVEPIETAHGVVRVAARVECVPGAVNALTAHVLRESLRGRVPDHALPRAIEFVPRLPRTPSGKIVRTAPAMQHREGSAATVVPALHAAHTAHPLHAAHALPAVPIAPVTARPDGLRQRAVRESWTQHLFDASAAGYDTSSGLAFLGTGRWYRRRMLRKAGLRSGMALLDVGSGTGLCAWIAQQEVGPEGRVVAVDPSPGMLEVARRRGVRETVIGRAEALPVPSSSFDMVSMSYMLRHIDDLVTAFGEARRVLRPGGRIVIFEVTRPQGALAAPAFRIAMHHVLPAIGVVGSMRVATHPMMRYWARTIDEAAGPHAVVSALEAAGFRGARHVLELGVFSCYRGVVV